MSLFITKNHLLDAFKTPMVTADESITKLTPAAVLVPIIEDPQELLMLFTERTTHLKHHPGQISFPGGGREKEDRDLIDTALRETMEEIGLQSTQINIIGSLNPVVSSTGFLVTPFIALLTPPLDLQLDTSEVASIFTAPLNFVLDRRQQKEELFLHAGQQRKIYAVNYQNYRIWGMTAQILVNLTDKLIPPL